ncbi:hypothetical protein BB560_001820 [Smittium megazygosporum]|uniref:Uncharacterized protein n=1 Tax=Smittium megazygosporum TaxID=133381 RepID=A0A2T9ZGL3_9FUNG|nr:hypothetical protein BB560_001820 [Smittium megazygosporum]
MKAENEFGIHVDKILYLPFVSEFKFRTIDGKCKRKSTINENSQEASYSAFATN